MHYSLGVEQQLTKYLEFSLEGFYKTLHNVVIQVPNEASTTNGVLYVNGGKGRIYGLETRIKWSNDGRFFGWLAYTLSRSERKDDPSPDWHVFQFDQTHILTVLASYK